MKNIVDHLHAALNLNGFTAALSDFLQSLYSLPGINDGIPAQCMCCCCQDRCC